MTSSKIDLNQGPIVNPGGNYVDEEGVERNTYGRRLPSSLLLTARERDLLTSVLGDVGNDFLARRWSRKNSRNPKEVYDARVLVDSILHKLTHEEK